MLYRHYLAVNKTGVRLNCLPLCVIANDLCRRQSVVKYKLKKLLSVGHMPRKCNAKVAHKILMGNTGL